MPEYTKKECVELRKLAGEVYEWELGRELRGLDESFRKWRQGKLLSSELSDAIHYVSSTRCPRALVDVSEVARAIRAAADGDRRASR